jgi:uncharacterized membrane protein YgcG
MRTVALFILLCSFVALPAQQKPDAPREASPAAQAAAKLSAEDVQALRQDLDHMKALLQQMESNLAFVDTTQSPLKHQFQLEIDMWRTVIASMERRLAESSR